MSQQERSQPDHIEIASDLTVRDLLAALAAGWADFRAEPKFGLLFASFFTLAGLGLSFTLIAGGETTWVIPVACGFPLLAPFVAVSFYEVSRQRGLGATVHWRDVLGAANRHGDGQILSLGVIMFVAFGFWMIVAHAIFAIFMAESGLGSHSFAVFTTAAGIAMITVGSIVGGLMALAFFVATVISLPLLVDRNVDFMTAIFASLRACKRNRAVMLIWAAIIAALLILAMLPLFVGLLVSLPVLGHASWHLYRRVAIKPD